MPVDFVLFVPCANGGAGENVHFTGTVHFGFGFTLDRNGISHVHGHFNNHGVTGVGETTGIRYQGTSVTQNVTKGDGSNNTLVTRGGFIGQGPGNDFVYRQVFHITVSAIGVVTALVDKTTVECR